MGDGKLGTHHGNTVAQLQLQMWSGNQIHTVAVYSGNIGTEV